MERPSLPKLSPIWHGFKAVTMLAKVAVKFKLPLTLVNSLGELSFLASLAVPFCLLACLAFCFAVETAQPKRKYWRKSLKSQASKRRQQRRRQLERLQVVGKSKSRQRRNGHFESHLQASCCSTFENLSAISQIPILSS